MTHTHEHDVKHRDETVERETYARDDAYAKFGGGNAGAIFFGWLVAVAIAVLLTGIVGAIATAVGDSQNITQTQAERSAGTIGLAAAITLVVVLVVGYYAGGYVAGRMSRYDGARQGLGVWVLGLVATALTVAAGWIFGDQYNVFDRVDLPRIPVPHDQLTWGGVLAGVIVLAATLLAAVAGGSVGQHYHARVDRYVER